MTTTAEERALLMRHPAGWIATGFFSGFSPAAPGTAGSLVALAPWFAVRDWPLQPYLLALAGTFALGVGACEWAVRRLQRADPACLVWDEFVGLWLALLPVTAYRAGTPWIAAAFILFRLFDIAKPWPVSWADRRLGGGFGVMADDVLAGACTALVIGFGLLVTTV